MINDYKCKNCGEEFEYFSVRSDDRPQCPKCAAKEDSLEKQIPKNTTFILNGKTWAKDGYGGSK
jgi:putative FmdB family regulatory protein